MMRIVHVKSVDEIRYEGRLREQEGLIRVADAELEDEDVAGGRLLVCGVTLGAYELRRTT